jgi:hypothetical protein
MSEMIRTRIRHNLTGVFCGVKHAARSMKAATWRSSGAALEQELIALSRRPEGMVSFAALSTLPAPAQRYFRTVLREGRPLIGSARVRQRGEFRGRESEDVEAGWRPFEARQVFTTDPPGFVWDAAVRMAPLLTVRVRDGYVGRKAFMVGALLGVVPVVKAIDRPELRAGALQRYLAESAWFPTALLPRDGLRWSPLDGRHARATLTDQDTTVSLDFEFGPTGEIVSTYTAHRQRAAGGRGEYVTLPWGGRYTGYQERGGVRVPLEAEVYWVVNGREQPYYRGHNLSIEYDGPP